jgi:hypothetical protein
MILIIFLDLQLEKKLIENYERESKERDIPDYHGYTGPVFAFLAGFLITSESHMLLGRRI